MFSPKSGMIQRTTSMNNSSDFVRWDIWLARVEFEDKVGSKIRPVLIIDGTRCYVLSLKITSHLPREGYEGEYRIVNWKEAGLLKPSTVRISKQINLPADSFVKRIGRLTALDRVSISQLYQELYLDSLS